MGQQIFISYSSHDRAYVLQLLEWMKAAELQPWLFEHDEIPSEYYVNQLMNVIADSRAVLVVLSRQSMHSMGVQQEILHAMDKGKRIIPLLFEDGDGPVRFLVRPYHWVDARHERFPISQIAAVLALDESPQLPVVRLTALEPYAEYVRPHDIVLEIPHHHRGDSRASENYEVPLCTIGVLPDRTLMILSSLHTVSKRHAHILAQWREHQRWSFLLYDTSRNGTFVNGQRIDGCCELTSDVLIGLARDAVVLRFTLLDRTTEDAGWN